jgi:ADP-ribose pyrophosphatase YjhB (NUDIX family)
MAKPSKLVAAKRGRVLLVRRKRDGLWMFPGGRKPTSVSGVDAITGQLKAYTSVVQSVEDFGADAGKRWRVAMLPN